MINDSNSSMRHTRISSGTNNRWEPINFFRKISWNHPQLRKHSASLFMNLIFSREILRHFDDVIQWSIEVWWLWILYVSTRSFLDVQLRAKVMGLLYSCAQKFTHVVFPQEDLNCIIAFARDLWISSADTDWNTKRICHRLIEIK